MIFLQEYKRIDIQKDQIVPIAERMRKQGVYLVMIHGFLNKQKLAVKLVNARTGKVYEPKEWFKVSVQTAIDVCRHIVDGDISLYRMNNVTGEIVKK